MIQQIANYQGAPNSDPNAVQTHIIVYNDTGAALDNGYIGMLGFEVTANAAGDPVVKTTLRTPKTEAVAVVQLAVVDDARGSIPNAGYGYACIRGVVDAKCDGTTDIALGDQLEVLTDGVSFIQGASASAGDAGDIVDECAAIAMEAYTLTVSANKKVLLLGKQVVVKGS